MKGGEYGKKVNHIYHHNTFIAVECQEQVYKLCISFSRKIPQNTRFFARRLAASALRKPLFYKHFRTIAKKDGAYCRPFLLESRESPGSPLFTSVSENQVYKLCISFSEPCYLYIAHHAHEKQ